MANITPKIVNAIYKTVFNFVGLLFIFLSIIATTIYIGLDLSQILKSNNIQNDKFFVMFQDKLNLTVENLIFPKFELSSEENSDPPTAKDILEYVKLFQLAIKKIDIHNLKVENYFNGDIFYRDGYIKILSDKNILEANIYIQKEKIYLDIHKIYISEYQINLTGDILLNSETDEIVFFSELSLKDRINISIAGEVQNFQDVSIRAKSKRIKDLKTIFDILKLPKIAYVWGVDRADYKYIKLNNISTYFQISDPKKALNNLIVNGEIKKLNYTFEPKLEPVKTEKVDFRIHNSDLYLNLNNLQYGKNIVGNWIKIRDLYSKPHLYLKVDGKLFLDSTLDKTIKYYSKLEKIPISISGNLDTDFYMDMKLYNDLAMRFVAEIDIGNSSPKSKTLPNINDGNIAYNYPENILKTKNIEFSYLNIVDGKVSGVMDISKSDIDFSAILNKVYIDQNSSMKSDIVKIDILGNIEDVIMINISPTDWSLKNFETNLSNFQVGYSKRAVKIYNLQTNLDEFNLSTDLNGTYNIQKNTSNIDLEIKNLKFSELNISKESFKIFLDLNRDIKVKIPKLLTKINISKNIFIDLKDVGLFRKYIPIAQNYPKVSGDVQINIDQNISIDGSINLKQRVLKDGDKFIEYFNFSGLIADEDMKFSVNDKIFIDKTENINILIDDYDFNITGLNDFIDMNSSEKIENDEVEKVDTNFSMNIQPEINIYLNGTSIFLTDSNNTFNSKSIFITVLGDRVYLKTSPLDRGEITVETKNDRYIVRALNLGEQFITSLSNFNGISGGDYNIYLKGEKGNFKGFIQFIRLKIKNMNLINNILAFINTVPALLTFSRPGFNHNGLRILAGYVEFEKIGDKIKFHDIQIKGESVDFSGKGEVDLAKNWIDMKVDISAIKYIDKFVENIPVANYLILGDDGSIATRILVKGKLTNPKISSEIHKDILYTPFKLTARVFNLPAKILEIFKYLNLNDKQNQENVKEFLKEIGF